MGPTASPRRAGGRPSKGDRKQMRIRPLRPVAERIEALAGGAELPVTEYAAALLGIGLAHLDELPAAFQTKSVLPAVGLMQLDELAGARQQAQQRAQITRRANKGDRKDVRAKPMRPVAEHIERLGAGADIPVTEYAAALLEIGLCHLDELPVTCQQREVLSEAG